MPLSACIMASCRRAAQFGVVSPAKVSHGFKLCASADRAETAADDRISSDLFVAIFQHTLAPTRQSINMAESTKPH